MSLQRSSAMTLSASWCFNANAHSLESKRDCRTIVYILGDEVLFLRLPTKVVDFVAYSYVWKWFSDDIYVQNENGSDFICDSLIPIYFNVRVPVSASLFLNIVVPGILVHKHSNMHCFLMYYVLMIGPKDVDQHP
jgi:hypothetical protein